MIPPRLSRKDFADLAQPIIQLESNGFAPRLTKLLGGQVRARPCVTLTGPNSGRTRNGIRAQSRSACGGLLPQRNRPAQGQQPLAAASAPVPSEAFGMATTAVELPNVYDNTFSFDCRHRARAGRRSQNVRGCFGMFGGVRSRWRATRRGQAQKRHFTVRAGLARSVSNSSRYLVKQGVCERSRTCIGSPAW
jgi:hypothetical protein